MKILPITVFVIIYVFISNIDHKSVATTSDKVLKIWALSDIQPRNRSDKKQFENAVVDINKNIKDIDFSIVAGDIVNRAEEESFTWYNEIKKKSYIKEWYEIAGNHDLKTDLGVLYKKKINKNIHYKIQKNNILFLFMSNENRGKSTVISEYTYNWWKELVENNNDKIIFVITHAPLKGSGIPFSSLKGRNIIDSDRFSKILKLNNVDVWLSGHMHMPHSITNNIVKKKDLNNTVFLNISSIRTELVGLKDSESFIITLECGSNVILFQSRNHNRYDFNKGLEYRYKLTKNYVCD